MHFNSWLLGDIPIKLQFLHSAQVQAKGPSIWLILGYGLVPSGTKPLPEPVFSTVGKDLWHHMKSQGNSELTQWNLNKIATVLQTTNSNDFSWKKSSEFLPKFYWNMFVKVYDNQLYFRTWLVAVSQKVTSCLLS